MAIRLGMFKKMVSFTTALSNETLNTRIRTNLMVFLRIGLDLTYVLLVEVGCNEHALELRRLGKLQRDPVCPGEDLSQHPDRGQH